VSRPVNRVDALQVTETSSLGGPSANAAATWNPNIRDARAILWTADIVSPPLWTSSHRYFPRYRNSSARLLDGLVTAPTRPLEAIRRRKSVGDCRFPDRHVRRLALLDAASRCPLCRSAQVRRMDVPRQPWCDRAQHRREVGRTTRSFCCSTARNIGPDNLSSAVTRLLAASMAAGAESRTGAESESRITITFEIERADIAVNQRFLEVLLAATVPFES
jgi:hypothetical protein